MFQKKKVGNYILIGQLGQGQFGVVYKARSIQNPNQVFAIKQVTREKVSKSQKVYELFQNEMTIMSQLNHPNIMHLYEFMETQNNYYLVLQYCNNGDLEQYLKKMGKLSEDEAVYFLMQIMNAFKVLNQNNVIHRDVKLANIFLNNDCIIVGDFGFAKQGEGMFFTILGTPITMAPELLETTKKPYTNKADLWSIGVCFYQMLFGKPPFDAINYEDLKIKVRTQSGQNLRFPSSAPISQNCKDLLIKLIQYQPNNRINWHEFFTHKLFEQHQKQPQDIYNINNSLLYRENEEKVKMEFQNNQGISNNKPSSFQNQQIDVVKNQNKVEEPQTNMTNNTNNIDQTENYQQNLQTIRARYVHEKKKIIFIMYTVRKLRNLAKRKDIFYNLSDRLMLSACLLLQKGLVLNQLTLSSLESNINTFGLQDFSNFVQSPEKSKFLKNFQEDQKIYDTFQNQMSSKFNQEVSTYEFRQEYMQFQNLKFQNLQFMEQVLHRHFLYFRSVVPELTNSTNNIKEINQYCLAILHLYLAIFSSQKIPFMDQNRIFEWKSFEKQNDIENARIARRQRENKLPSQHPLQNFEKDQKDLKIGSIPKLNGMSNNFQQSILQNSQAKNVQNNKPSNDQMYISMGHTSYFKENSQTTPMDSKKITFNEVSNLPLKNSHTNMKQLANSNMQESLIQNTQENSQRFQKQNLTSNHYLNEQVPDIKVIEQSNSPQNQLIEENFSLKTKLQTAMFKNEQLEMEKDELQNRLSQLETQNKSLIGKLEHNNSFEMKDKKLQYYVEILDNKNKKIQQLTDEIKKLESKLLQLSQQQNPDNQTFQSQKFRSLMNKFDPMMESQLKSNNQNNEYENTEKMIVKIEKPVHYRQHSQSYEQTPKRDYKISYQQNERKMTNQEQNEVRTLYSKHYQDEPLKYSLPKRSYNNTSTTYYQVPVQRHEQQPNSEYGNYRYSSRRQSQYGTNYNQDRNDDVNGYISVRQSVYRQAKDSYRSQEPRIIKRVRISNSPNTHHQVEQKHGFREYSVTNRRLPRYVDQYQMNLFKTSKLKIDFFILFFLDLIFQIYHSFKQYIKNINILLLLLNQGQNLLVLQYKRLDFIIII